MKATVLLRKEHETILALLAQLEKPARGSERADRLQKIRQEIQTLWQVEEEVLYPELKDSPASSSASELVDKAIGQHQEISRLLVRISEDASGRKAEAEFAVLTKKLEEHILFEEEELFEEARRALSEYRMEEMGLEMEARRHFLRLSAA